MRSSLSGTVPLLLGLALAACSDSGQPGCAFSPSAPTVDTLIGLKAGGHLVLFSSLDDDFVFQDTVTGELFINAYHETPGEWRTATLQIPHVTAPGAFGVSGSIGYPGVAYVRYACQVANLIEQPVNDGTYLDYRPAGVVGDSVWVTSFNGVTGEVAGVFHFTGAPMQGGPDLVISEGHFHGIASRGVFGGSSPIGAPIHH